MKLTRRTLFGAAAIPLLVAIPDVAGANEPEQFNVTEASVRMGEMIGKILDKAKEEDRNTYYLEVFGVNLTFSEILVLSRVTGDRHIKFSMLMFDNECDFGCVSINKVLSSRASEGQVSGYERTGGINVRYHNKVRGGEWSYSNSSTWTADDEIQKIHTCHVEGLADPA